MKSNVGGIERVIRGVAGLGLIAFGYMGGLESPWNIVAIGAGSVFAVTAVIKFCPLFQLMGMSTCKKCNDE